MNYYTQTISVDLAEKLKEKGMLIANVVDSITGKESCRYTYAHIFDWLMYEKRQYIWIEPHFRASGERFSFRINFSSDERIFETWHDAANAAIEKALTLI